MTVERIKTLRRYRCFTDFSWPQDLPNFARYNLIYGWNGSGKTCLSNLFRHLQRSTSFDEGEAVFQIDERLVSGTAIPTATIPGVRVFNRDSVDRTIFEVPNQQLAPIYVLGEDSASKQQEVESLKRQLTIVKQEEVKSTTEVVTAESEYERFCKDRAQEIKNLLTAPGGPYNFYDKGTFKTSVRQLTSSSATPVQLAESKVKQYIAIKGSSPMEKLPLISVNIPELSKLTIQVQRLLQESVFSETIPEILSDGVVGAWVQQGLRLHTGENRKEKCFFCGNAISSERLDALNRHFNDRFHQFQNTVDGSIQELIQTISKLESISLPSKTAFYSHLTKEYEECRMSVSQQLSVTVDYITSLKNALEQKKLSPFSPLELSDLLGSVEAPALTAVTDINNLILEHNRHTDDFAKEVSNARDLLLRDEVVKALPEYQSREYAIKAAGDARDDAKEKGERLSDRIRELELQVRQHQRPAEELNREIASYLGRDELRFEVKEAGYTITRNGKPALNLSEGERTAIAFMHFLKSLSDTSFDLAHGVVVIDDPVSSLDENSLYCASGYLQSKTSNAGQLFVLTHNFTFFRQVRSWLNSLPGQKKPDISKHSAHFYMLSSGMSGASRTSLLGPLDPLLRDFESEYQYLFKCVYEAAHISEERSIAEYYGLPNIARRLLESFLMFKIPNQAGRLYRKLESVSFDPAKKARIYRFINTYSHFDQIGEPVHDASVLIETPAILNDILAMMRYLDAGHCESMVELIAANDEVGKGVGA